MPHPPGMTLIEVVITGAMFTLLIFVSFNALSSAQRFTRTNTTQVELQESAREALEFVKQELQNAGEIYDAGGTIRYYPRVYLASDGIPTAPIAYDTNLGHAPKHPPKARVGTLVFGGDPTLDSDEIIYKKPLFKTLADGFPPEEVGQPRLSGNEIVWSNDEFAFVVAPGPDGVNQLELRNSSDCAAQIAAGNPVQGRIVARYVDRIRIEYGVPPLTTRQIRVTLFLTRRIPLQGVLVDRDDLVQSILVVSMSTVIDMRNTSTEGL